MLTRVTKSSLAQVVAELGSFDTLIWDIESTGLSPYHNSKMFSLALADLDGNSWYFNFKPYPDLGAEYVLEPRDLEPIMSHRRRWIAHNAKFDLHFTDRSSIRPAGPIFDTEVLARLYENHHQFRGGYSLASCAERWLEIRKDDRVKKWMDENGAYSLYPNAAGTATFKHYYFDLVPFELISEYACQDAVVTGQLFKLFTEKMYETQCVQTEVNLTSVLFEMEKLGLKVDRKYCLEAHLHENRRAQEYKKQLECLLPGFTDSAKFLAPVLEARGFVLPTTEKGNPQITDDVLSQKPDDELAGLVLQLRDAEKRLGTYWANYLAQADDQDVLHPNFRQSGTVTGRMSCDNPNLQNIPAEDTGVFPVRRAFIPRSGFFFCSIDFAQIEFRLMLEYARETELIEKIKAGLDPHQATADLTGLSRKAAKTLNFGIIYRMGIAKIARALGISDVEAKAFRDQYFRALPKVREFIFQTERTWKTRGYTFNWCGRRYILEDPKFAYKAGNAIIQGGCADIVKIAMVNVSNFLADKKSRMVLQVHDELVCEIHESERSIIPEIKAIMLAAYPHRYMPMDCSISVGNNFHDMGDFDGGGTAETTA